MSHNVVSHFDRIFSLISPELIRGYEKKFSLKNTLQSEMEAFLLTVQRQKEMRFMRFLSEWGSVIASLIAATVTVVGVASGKVSTYGGSVGLLLGTFFICVLVFLQAKKQVRKVERAALNHKSPLEHFLREIENFNSGPLTYSWPLTEQSVQNTLIERAALILSLEKQFANLPDSKDMDIVKSHAKKDLNWVRGTLTQGQKDVGIFGLVFETKTLFTEAQKLLK